MTGQPPKITIVLPNYNHGHYLRQSLGAILGQERPADEVIIIDDASTDDSVAVIEAMIAGRNDVRFIKRPERRGVIPSLNEGLASAQGDFICFTAADDHLYPDFTRRAEAALLANPGAALASAGVNLWDDHGRVIGTRPAFLPSTTERWIGPDEFRDILRSVDNFLLTQVGLFRRQPLLALGGFDESLGPACDGVLARRVVARDGFVFIPRVLGVWRMTGSNYFKQTIDRPQIFAEMQARIGATLDHDPPGTFPHGYGDLLQRRLWFGSARHVAATAEDPDDVRRFLAGADGRLSPIERLAGRIGRLRRRPARLVVAGLLFLRFRPFSLFRFLTEPFRRGRFRQTSPRSGR